MAVSNQRKGYISRRDFLKISTVAVAGAGLAACQPRQRRNAQVINSETSDVAMSTPDQYPDIPFAPPVPPPYILITLTTAEAKLMEALTARIYPGNPDDPGAREAGVTNYVDKKLAFHDGFVEYTYIQPPHAKAYEGDKPPDQKADEHGEIIWVKKSEIERYGYQSLMKPIDRYRAAFGNVDRFAQEKFGKKFVDLSEAQQDELLDAMEKGNAPDYFKDPTGKQFFMMLQEDTIQGMFSDPAYGGNKDMIGWKQIGYPGAQRAYTPVDMNTEGPVRPPQSIAMLHRFHAGMGANPNVILPLSGSQYNPNP